MKKLDDKMLNEAKVGDVETKNNDGADAMTCDCCNISSSTTTTLLTEVEGEQGKEDFDQAQEDNKYKKKKFDNPKLLIVIGLALTIPIVLLEITQHNIIIDYVTLALATPVQFILGNDFIEQ
jgi:cation transport ATPase